MVFAFQRKILRVFLITPRFDNGALYLDHVYPRGKPHLKKNRLIFSGLAKKSYL